VEKDNFTPIIVPFVKLYKTHVVTQYILLNNLANQNGREL